MVGICSFVPPTLLRLVSEQKNRIMTKRRRSLIRAEVSGTPKGSTSESTEVLAPVVITPPPNFKPPLPKRFGVRPDKILDIIGASLALIFRLGTGVFVEGLGYSVSFMSKDDIPSDQYAFEIAGLKLKETSKLGPQPEKPIEIYEFESYLMQTLTEGFAMIGRMGRGSSYTPAKLPPKPLELWAYEGSPFCKVVREVLVELELPHLLHNPKRQMLLERARHFQVPYLEDPNTGVKTFESATIVEYLQATYVS